MYSVASPVGDQLGEHHSGMSVVGGVADVVLARTEMWGVNDKLVGGWIEGGGCLQRLDVGAVVGFGHGETAGQGHRHHRFQQLGVMRLGAEAKQRPAEQPELHPEFCQQAEVVVGDDREGPQEVALGSSSTMLRRKP